MCAYLFSYYTGCLLLKRSEDMDKENLKQKKLPMMSYAEINSKQLAIYNYVSFSVYMYVYRYFKN